MQPWKKMLLAKIAAVAGLLTATETGAMGGTLDVTHAWGHHAEAGEFTIHLDDVNLLGAYNPIVLVGDGSYFPAGTEATFLGTSFQTFCLERTSYFPASNGWTGWAVYDISYSLNYDGWAMSGGGGASGTPLHDEISRGTAYLYSQFAAGTLAGYHYTEINANVNVGANRVESALKLQRAIWYLEDEMTYAEATAGGNIFLDLLGGMGSGTAFQNILAWKTQNNDGFYNVGVLNIGAGPAYGYQDQLVAFPVPDGGRTLMLMGLAMGALWVARRWKSAA